MDVNLHYIPVYRQTYYEDLRFKAGHCSEAEERYYAEAFSLPMYPGLTEVQDKVIEVLQVTGLPESVVSEFYKQ